MKIKSFFSIIGFFLFLLSFNINAQTEEFIGIIELENKTYIDFRISFDIEDTTVKGYTITDYNGLHESKSSIVGNYNEKTNEITFREVDILYSKSPVTELDFCYIFFSGTLKKDKMMGDFKGFYEDLEKCLNGKIFSTRIEKAEKRKETLLNKVNKIVKDDTKRDSISEKIENLKLSQRRGITANENINVFWEGTYLKVFIWDAGIVDNDQIEISVNDDKHTLVNPKKDPIVKEYYLGGDKNTISIKAISEGFDPPNTTKVKFTDGKGKKIELIYNLKVDEAATLTFYRKKPSQLRSQE